MKEFVDSIIRDNALNLALVGHCTHYKELKSYDPETVDVVLLFDGDTKNLKKITSSTGIPREKLRLLW